ncbi:class I SAM-dependent methyltransferase [Magnetospira sp. QH-2]|uniref:class I SAM-dependent methyltransferase n=1 Tax=Magnetospira sp. (strain QH-2) TaxID=1288970 RepID=UPI0005FA459B|nr:class I SAM-dependent methyltransferase [Magnetospira sp. QH-2]
MADFYQTYEDFKDYRTPGLKPKHIRQFDREFWTPASCSVNHSVLEVGCGAGQFLLYLKAKGISDFLGIDHDPALAPVIDPTVAGQFEVHDVWAFLQTTERTFDRIALFDVLEHFSADDGAKLLAGLKARLNPGGCIVVRVPNASSPWGLQYQYGDLTHCTAYTPSSLKQVGQAAGLPHVTCMAQVQGSRARRLTEALLHGLLNKLLTRPPEIWTANVLAVFAAGVK